jgi:3-hydroxymyristoyl/3-hydroxydecanoyl-(acyl carrier protein) dehydratase
MRFLLVDRIDELKKFEYAVGTKCISLSDDCFEHHFPGQPVYPGALLLESMAQLGGALLELSLREVMDYTPRCVLTTVKAKFRDFVKPGDVVALRAEILSRHEDSAMVQVTSSCEQRRVAQAEMLYVYLKVDDERLDRARNDFLDVVTRQTRIIE